MKIQSAGMGLSMLCVVVYSVGCNADDREDIVIGGIGEIVGGMTGSSTAGKVVGMGVGYVIGDEEDEEKAAELTANSEPPHHAHSEVGPMGGTHWMVESITPPESRPAFASKIVEFRPYGRVITTTTTTDGKVVETDEYYRVVDDALIVNGRKRMINAKFKISNDQLVVTATDVQVDLRRKK
ncbi:MAG: hypothetical protein ACYTHJ_05615 [Planctomycetota bacterium]|jgi:hypothetical protein